MKGLGAESEEKREPVSDIDIVVADGLKVLDLKRPIREADVGAANPDRTGPSFEDGAFRHMGPAGPENLADLAQRGGEAAKVLND